MGVFGFGHFLGIPFHDVKNSSNHAGILVSKAKVVEIEHCQELNEGLIRGELKKPKHIFIQHILKRYRHFYLKAEFFLLRE